MRMNSEGSRRVSTLIKSPKKYTGIIPDQESITIVDTSPTQTKPSIVATARNTIEQELNEDNILNPDFLTKPKVFWSNKYIGVYNGKFGILTKKVNIIMRLLINFYILNLLHAW